MGFNFKPTSLTNIQILSGRVYLRFCAATQEQESKTKSHLDQSQYTETGPTSPSIVLVMPSVLEGKLLDQKLSHRYDPAED